MECAEQHPSILWNMEDPERLPNNANADNAREAVDEEAELRRRAEEAMEQMLLAQEEEEEKEEQEQEGEDPNLPIEGQLEDVALEDDDDAAAQFDPLDEIQNEENRKASFSYVRWSFLAAVALVYYALRSHQQWYLTLVFLSSSKWAYVVLGNALVASLISTFQNFTRLFMGGLRLAEAEGLGDFFRWNITETCLALTIFRSELDVKTGIFFLILVLAKCLHWVADMREGHLRMTEESVIASPTTQWPAVRWSHFRLLMFLCVLQLLDIMAVVHCGTDILQHGVSVSILFAFEGAILLVSVISSILLWYLHAIDGLFHYFHESSEPTSRIHGWIHPWKDHKATLVFAVEVQAQAAKFVFYLTFFSIVMTYYGMPINLFREVYLSFQALKQRLVAFNKYRQLMASMNRFASPTPEELEEEPICIICRDHMTAETTKKLPGCGHMFHKSCLREWLVQQQSCPTCRGDISEMEARQRQQDVAEQRQQEMQQQQPEEERETESQNEGPQNVTETEEATVDKVTSQKSSLKETPQSQSSFKDAARVSTSEEMEKKPAARKIREKRVRVRSIPEKARNDDDTSAFPALYRVVHDHGATVYNYGDAQSFVIRLVPFGVIILGQELAWRDCDGEKQLMVRMPDGWVREDDIERIVALPLGR